VVSTRSKHRAVILSLVLFSTQEKAMSWNAERRRALVLSRHRTLRPEGGLFVVRYQARVAGDRAALKNHKTSKLAPSLIAANLEHIGKAAFGADQGEDQRARRRAHKVRGPPTDKQVARARIATRVAPLLYGRRELVAATGLSYPTLWLLMRRSAFPRGFIVGGLTKWRARDIEKWLNELPPRPVKPLDPEKPKKNWVR
jgi:predicted DNA-binding transcriptional regulator AlpA